MLLQKLFFANQYHIKILPCFIQKNKPQQGRSPVESFALLRGKIAFCQLKNIKRASNQILFLLRRARRVWHQPPLGAFFLCVHF